MSLQKKEAENWLGGWAEQLIKKKPIETAGA